MGMMVSLSSSFFVRQTDGEEGGRVGIYRLAGLAWLEGVGFSLRLKSKMGEVCNFSKRTQVKNLHHF